MSNEDDISDRSPAYLFGQIKSQLEEQARRDVERDRRNNEAHTAILTRLEKTEERVGKLENMKAVLMTGIGIGGTGGLAGWWKNLSGQ